MNLKTISIDTCDERIFNFLNAEILTDENLKTAVEKNPDTTLEGLNNYLYEEARKLAEGKNKVRVDDNVVFSWCKDYFVDYEIRKEAEAKKKAEAEARRKQDQARILEQAEKAKQQATSKSASKKAKKATSNKQIEEDDFDFDEFEKELQADAEALEATSKSTSKKANPKVDKPVVAVVEKKIDKPIEDKNKNKGYEQLSLFDMFS